MPVQNVSFEGAQSGSLLNENGGEFEANFWTLFEGSTATEFASFGNSLVFVSAEWFETSWDNDNFQFSFAGAPYDLEIYVFNPGPYASTAEHFERGWDSNEDFQFELVRLEEAEFASGDRIDTFENGWDNDSFLFAFNNPSAQLEAATVSPEDFESSWGVDAYLWEYDDPGTQLEAFSIWFSSPSTYQPYETFVNPQEYEYWVGMSGTEPIASGIDFVITVNGAQARYQSTAGDTRETVTDALVLALAGLSGVKSEESTSVASAIWIGAEDPSIIVDPEFDFNVKATIENNQGTDVVLSVNWWGNSATSWPQSGVMRTFPIE